MTGKETESIRKTLGWNKTRWALILNVSHQTVYRWEAGGSPSGTVVAILAAVKVALDEGVPADRIRARLAMGVGPLVYNALKEATSG